LAGLPIVRVPLRTHVTLQLTLCSDHPEDGPAFDQIALFQEEEWGTLCRSASRHACFKKANRIASASNVLTLCANHHREVHFGCVETSINDSEFDLVIKD
jgi:hypothetical protein